MSADINRVRAVFGEAAALPKQERAAWLDRACEGDADLRRRSDVSDDDPTTRIAAFVSSDQPAAQY